MAKPGKVYGLDITVQPVEIDEKGNKKNLGTTTQTYQGMEYGDMVVAQKAAIIGLVEALTGLGLAVAEELKKKYQELKSEKPKVKPVKSKK